jgi:outer membrane immunogenic protein
MKWFLAAAAALISGSGLAADLTGVETPVLPAAAPALYDWTGPYVGVHGGYGLGEADFDFIDVPSSASETDIDGGFLGVQAGYDHQFGSGLLLGAEADVASSQIGGSDRCPNPVVACEAELDWLGSVRARAGFGFARALAYATGGLGVADAEFDTSGGLPVPGFNDAYFGWTIGGGVEAALWWNWSAKLEYLFYDLGDETADVGEISGLSRAELDPDLHTFKFGVNYRF